MRHREGNTRQAWRQTDAGLRLKRSSLIPDHLISHRAFIKSFCKSEFPHKSVILSFMITYMKYTSTDLCGNCFFHNDFINTFCETKRCRRRRRARCPPTYSRIRGCRVKGTLSVRQCLAPGRTSGRGAPRASPNRPPQGGCAASAPPRTPSSPL